MFYPVDSLKRGGRFYLCWVADSWPLRFAAITHRQLWSQDIRKLCDDLLEVMTNESGRPTNRFSLRLSSQLMRGLVRLYERKVSVFLGDLCMLNAHVFKHANKKFVIRDTVIIGEVDRRLAQLSQLPGPIHEEPEEERVEDLIRNSGNIVGNVQDITLKEAAIPEFQLPPNDGFGEEHPDQSLQQLVDRTVEMMLQHTDSSAPAQLSALELPALESLEQSRLALSHHMERLSEHDLTLFKKSVGDELLPIGDIEKDIPEIPDILPPEMPAPSEKQVTEKEHEESPEPVAEPPKAVEAPTRQEPEEMELEELEEVQPRKRRGKAKLIVDKRIKLSAGFLRSRIDKPNVELRCEDSTDDIADTRVSWLLLMRRPAHAGAKFYSAVSDVLTRMFQMNLGFVAQMPLADRELEEAVAEQPRRRTRSVLEKIVEEEEQAPIPQVELPQIEVPAENAPEIINILEPLPVPRISIQEPMDIADLPTQKLETLSQIARKRTSEHETSAKRARLSGYISFRESNQQLQMEIVNEPDKENIPPQSENIPPQSENIPPQSENIQPQSENIPQQSENVEPPRDHVRSVSTMLQEAGLADIQPCMPEVVEQILETQQETRTRRHGSESSETQLGSLDRTKVSLGDSVTTTDSQRFIRNQWGIEGTMVKILSSIKAGVSQLTVEILIAKGPVISGYKSIIAARCFTSILKLKQHAFLKIEKDPDTLEIRNITLGPKFDGLG